MAGELCALTASGKLGTDMPRKASAPQPLPVIIPHPLEHRRAPFDDPDFLFEVKADGFRGVLYVAHGEGYLMSRNGRELRRTRPLADALARSLKVQSAIFDGEVVVKDATGRDIFLNLMRRQGEASYVAFDLLWLNGRDLRDRPLTDRKRALRRVLPRRSKLIREALCVPDADVSYSGSCGVTTSRASWLSAKTATTCRAHDGLKSKIRNTVRPRAEASCLIRRSKSIAGVPAVA